MLDFTNRLLKPNFPDPLGSELQLLRNHLYQLNTWNIYMICFPAQALQQNLKQREERFLPIFHSHEYLRCEHIWQLSTLSQEHLWASCCDVAIHCPTSKVAEFSESMFVQSWMIEWNTVTDIERTLAKNPVVFFMCLLLVMLFVAASLLCARPSAHREFTNSFSFQPLLTWEKLRLHKPSISPEALT